jgi:orotidine-5'-phosphate decarboxylase
MNAGELYEQISQKGSFLCVGLDTDITRIPEPLKHEPSPLYAFNRAIIDATHDLAVAYKPNLAFYEAQGIAGWEALSDTVAYIRNNYPGLFLIADAKRGDIGNTAKMYARTYFGGMDFDAVTLSPYMGKDTVMPFLEYEGKWVILLGLTSNPGAENFQLQKMGKGPLYAEVLRRGATWGSPDNVMFVAGATRPELFREIREIVPEHYLLVPGIGAQGGNLQEVAGNGMNDRCGLIVNASRSVIYAGSGESFARDARREAEKLRKQMSALLT